MKKIAVVNGGTRGVGRDVALKLWKGGYSVYATFAGNHDAAEKVRLDSNNEIVTEQVDCSDYDAVLKFKERLFSGTSPDVLVNCAGISGDALFMNQHRDSFNKVMGVNFGGVYNFCSIFLPAMAAKREGNIVNVSSIAASKIKLGNIAYGCSKAAIERLSLGLALEFARFNIKVNCIAPGFVDTDMFDNFAGESRSSIIKEVPARSILSSNEVAELIYHVSTRTVNTTGSIIRMGNGENI